MFTSPSQKISIPPEIQETLDLKIFLENQLTNFTSLCESEKHTLLEQFQLQEIPKNIIKELDQFIEYYKSLNLLLVQDKFQLLALKYFFDFIAFKPNALSDFPTYENSPNEQILCVCQIFTALPDQEKTTKNLEFLFVQLFSEIKASSDQPSLVLPLFKLYLEQLNEGSPHDLETKQQRAALFLLTHYNSIREVISWVRLKDVERAMSQFGFLHEYIILKEKMEKRNKPLHQLLKDLDDVNKTSYDLLYTLGLFPEQVRDETLENILASFKNFGEFRDHFNISYTDDGALIYDLFHSFLNYSSISLEKWKETWIPDFQDTNPKNVKFVLEKMKFLFAHGFEYDVTEPFFIEFYTAGLRLQNSEESNNAFTVHTKLLENRSRQVALPETSGQDVEGQMLSLNVNFLRDCQTSQRILASDLPIRARRTFFTQKISFYIGNQENPQFLKEVIQKTGESWKHIKKQSLGTTYLTNLLDYEDHIQQTPDLEISIISAKFSCMIDYIQSFSDTTPSGNLLSELDITLLKALTNIAGCSTGKDGGIEAYYENVLPIDYHLAIKVANISKGQSLVYKSVLSVVEEFLNEGQSSFYKKLCGLQEDKEVVESVHQTKYVKNLIGHQIGLNREIKFEINSQILYPDLLERTQEEALKEFYTYMTPTHFTTQMRLKLNQSLSLRNNTTYSVLSQDKHFPFLQNSGAWKVKETKTGEYVCLIKQSSVVQILTNVGLLLKQTAK